MASLPQEHFEDYNNLQHTKHKIIHEYLNGWFPKLGFTSGEILYLDTHSGPGRYKTGEYGSPLVAINTFLNHQARDRILKNCTVNFVFMEQDETNANSLELELQKLGKLPNKIYWKIIRKNAFEYLEKLQDSWEKSNTKLPPSFMFIDPFGFTVPCNLLKRLKSHPSSEILLNVMWRELDMSMRQKEITESWKSKLDFIFGGGNWTNIREIETFNDRAEATAQLFKKQIGSKWATHIKMLGANNTIRYFLLHLTDNNNGCDLMKKVFWNCCPDGDWQVKKSDSQGQGLLFGSQPEMSSLQKWLLDQVSLEDKTWKELEKQLLAEIWLPKHLWQEIKTLCKSNEIRIIGKAIQKANPTISLPE